MAVRCSEPPNLSHDDSSLGWSSLNSPFSSCWSPVPVTDPSWHNVYNWINSSQNSESEGESVRSSSSSQTHSSPKQSVWYDDNEVFPSTTPPMGPFTTTELPHNTHKYPVKEKKTELAPNPYASIIQELLKLNIQQTPSVSSPIAHTPSSSSSHPNIYSWKEKGQMVETPKQHTPLAPIHNHNMVQPVQHVQQQQPQPQSLMNNIHNHRQIPSTASAPIPSMNGPRPIVGQMHREDDWRRQEHEPSLPMGNTGGAEWMNQMDAQRQQQAVYEQMYQMMVGGISAQQTPQTTPWQQQQQQSVPGRPLLARSNSSAMELHVRLEECSDEYRQLEKERKQTEAELARHNLGKKISSSNSMPIPRLPTAPSRVDRLIVDFFREHARIVTLLGKMEQLRGATLPPSVHGTLSQLLQSITVLQQCRHAERSVILQQLRGEILRYNDEKETLALAQALSTVRKAVIRARAANWVSLTWTIGVEDAQQQQVIDRLISVDFNLSPPPIKSRPVKQH